MTTQFKNIILSAIADNGIELAELTGSDRQIKWAEEIRLSAIDLLGVSKVAKCKPLLDIINSLVDSEWWIEHDDVLGVNKAQTLKCFEAFIKR